MSIKFKKTLTSYIKTFRDYNLESNQTWNSLTMQFVIPLISSSETRNDILKQITFPIVSITTKTSLSWTSLRLSSTFHTFTYSFVLKTCSFPPVSLNHSCIHEISSLLPVLYNISEQLYGVFIKAIITIIWPVEETSLSNVNLSVFYISKRI